MKFISSIVCISSIFFIFIEVCNAGLYTSGDMNSDGKIGLEEAILALKTVAGISFQGKDENESNDYESEANVIAAVSTVSGKIGYSGDQEDWFKIVAPENGLLQITIKNLNSEDSTNGDIKKCLIYQKDAADLILIDYIPHSVAHGIEAGDTITSKPLPVFENGIYYIKIPQWETHVAPYEIKTSFIKLQLDDSGEPNSNYSEAQLIQEDQMMTSLIGYGNDEEDWYKIQMTENGLFQFSVKNLHSADIENGDIKKSFLYQKVGADLVPIAYAPNSVAHGIEAGDIKACPKSAVAKNGIYFIQVPQYEYDASPYQLNTSITKMQTEDYGEPNDNKDEAQIIQGNQVITSLIGYGNDEEDWYMIQMAENGLFQFSVDNLHPTDVENGDIKKSFLYQKVGADLVPIAYAPNSVAHGIEAGDIKACPEMSVEKGGVYLIQVPQFEYDASPYQLQTFFTPN